MIHCPRCDKPIAPDHRCLSRRHFFGMFVGAAAAAVLVPPAVLWPTPRRTAVKLEPWQLVISNQLYRLPFHVYQGGAYRRYSPDGGDLGIGAPLHIIRGPR